MDNTNWANANPPMTGANVPQPAQPQPQAPAPESVMYACPTCGTLVPYGTKFCPTCGTQFAFPEANPAPSAPAPQPQPAAYPAGAPAYTPPEQPYGMPAQPAKKSSLPKAVAAIAIAALVGGGAFFIASRNSSQAPSGNPSTLPTITPIEPSSPETPSTPTGSANIDWTPEGTYLVGTDLPAGEYFAVATDSIMSVEVDSDDSGDFESIIAMESSESFMYFTVSDGQYLTVDGGQFVSVSAKDAAGITPSGLGEGMYKVGIDLEPGEYLVEATDGGCYFSIESNSLNVFESIIINDYFEDRRYITLEEGTYFKLSDGALTPIASVTPAKPNANGVYAPGMYKVGFDITAGTYEITATDELAFYTVYNRSTGHLNDVADSNLLEAGQTATITVSDGQYVQVIGGTLAAK